MARHLFCTIYVSEEQVSDFMVNYRNVSPMIYSLNLQGEIASMVISNIREF